MNNYTSSDKRLTFIERLKGIGPATITTAACIGPGSVTTLSVIGATYEYGLLWMLVLFIFFHIAQSDMCARIALGGGKTFQQAIREDIENPILRKITIIIIVVSVFVTCIIYQFGSLMGVGIGLNFFFPNISPGHLAGIAGVIAIPIILMANLQAIENVLKYLILGFTASFLITIILTRPNMVEVMRGAFIPSIPRGAGPHMMSLTGTSMITGYLFFIQTTAIKEKWSGPSDIYRARSDIFIMSPITILVSAMIMITAGATLYRTGVDITSAAVLGEQLIPLYGNKAKFAFGIGLACAGFSSVIPAGMGPGIVIPGILGFESSMKTKFFKVLIIINLSVASLMAFVGTKPVILVMSAQALGAIFIPITSFILLMLTNNKKLMKNYTNNFLVNLVGILAVIFSLIISITSLSPMISNIFAK